MSANHMHGLFRTSALVAMISVAAGIGVAPVPVRAATDGTVNLLATPPELTSSVAPNLVLTLDDSGSMGRNFMPDQRPYTGAGWGATDQQNTTSSASYPSGAGPYLCAGLIDPRITDSANPRSWAMNGVYYNPNATYRPPLLADGLTQMPDANFTAAWDNGIQVNRPNSPAASTQRNLGTGTRFCGNAAGYYRLKTGVALPLDADGLLTATARSNLYTASNWEWVALPAAERQNFANWYSYYHTRHLAAKTAVSRAYAPFDENIRVAWQNINQNQIGGSTSVYKFKDVPSSPAAGQRTVRTRFYDWLFSSPVSGGTPNQAATRRAGDLFTRSGAVDTNPYWDRDLDRELSCRQNFHINMSDGFWNSSTVTTALNDMSGGVLPDGRTFSTSDTESSIVWNQSGPNQRTMADIAYHYWATNLRPDFMGDPSTRLKVPPFIPDRSTSLFGVPLPSGVDPRDNKEIFWNPANDPASWPHVVQFMIGFGISGTIPRTDFAYEQLRLGHLPWPALAGSSPYSDTAPKVDDIWHAAVNSRGKFFAASNPEELISALSEIIASIIARRGASTAMSVSLPLVTDGTTGYSAGYDTTDWSGFVTRNRLDPETVEAIGVDWDAGCKLTGGPCPSMPGPTYPVRDPNTRVIYTSDGVPGTRRDFTWGGISARQRERLSVDPSTIRLDLPESARASCGGASARWECDSWGEERVEYLRGNRTHETTTLPKFRTRSSVLGAVIKAQPEYVSSPVSGYRNLGSGSEFTTYADYQNNQRSRTPMLYVGSNDGMLHAFHAQTGEEAWAYVPNLLIENFRLTKSTQNEVGLVAGVDAAPGEIDVDFNDGNGWRTMLVGALRLGGRGVYAIDVTNPVAPDPLWEFTSGPQDQGIDGGDACTAGVRYCRSLGYTYDSVNVTRLNYEVGGNHWFAIVSSGYFPTDPLDPASNEVAAGRTSLLVIDLKTGRLVREIQTSTATQAMPPGFKTFGLSTPVIYDSDSNQVGDFAVAGDLAGNLWRFDLSGDDPAAWTVDLMFTTYGNGGAAAPGDQPFSFMPTSLRDPTTLRPIHVIGAGKYIGLPDRTSLIPEQAFYGIRDMGTGSAFYPIRVSDLVTQHVAQAADVRQISGWSPPASVQAGAPDMMLADTTTGDPVAVPALGWRLPINVGGSNAAAGAPEAGERAQRRAAPLFSANLALLYSLIPKGEDPCDPGARYALMVVDAATGGARTRTDPAIGTIRGIGTIGAVLGLASPPGNPVTRPGGGGLLIPGLPATMDNDIKEALEEALADDVWHRNAWRELLDQLL